MKTEESFCNDTANEKVGEPVVTFEVKDQEIDMQMSQNRQDPTNRKLDMGQACHSSLWLVYSGKMKHVIQIKIHVPLAVVKILIWKIKQYRTGSRSHCMQIIAVLVTIQAWNPS